MRAMWEEPACEPYFRIACPTVVIPVSPTPERADSERAKQKQAHVDAAEKAIPRCRGRWIPESFHDIGYHKPGTLARVMDEFLSGLG